MAFEKIQKMQQELREEIQKFGKKELAAAFKEFFDLFPDVAEVRWTQYTPHFNDGEPCLFSVSEPALKRKSTEMNKEELKDYRNGYGEGDMMLDDESEALNKFLYNEASEPVLKSVFGDGVMVVATPKGFKTEDYDHD